MTSSEFQPIIENTLKALNDTLIVKGKEYVRGDNRLHNFEVGAAITGKTREDVLWGFALKHYISIQDIKNDVKEGKLPTREMLDEKYNDLIIYLLLEKASMIDRINNSYTKEELPPIKDRKR